MRRLLCSLFTLLTIGCGDPRPTTDDFTHACYEPQYASGFEILATPEGRSTLLRVHNPWQGAGDNCSELFIRRNQEPLPKGFTGAVLEKPAQRIVCLSSSYIAMLDALGAVERVVGVSGIDFISNAYIRTHRAQIGDVGYDSNLNYELLVALDPDLVLLYGVSGASELEPKLRELAIPYLYIGEYLEQSPLGKAEWMVLMAELLDEREEGIRRFAPLPERYHALCDLVAAAPARPRVMLNTPYRDTWYMPSVDNYVVQLIHDAGGDYLYPENQSNSSVAIDLERAYLLCAEADIWLHQGTIRSLAELQQRFPRFADVPCIKRGQLYNNTLRTTEAGGNDFWESGVVRPDRILQDLIRILHPELLPQAEDLYYYKPLQ
ncbi:MAG: ABC transporter substrate-binding protein [Alistipes sp.]|nr:iron ABC transporter substrate-binding protein [Rikenellaceae bacterium]MBQ8915746.1 ABC transporter substrate-binding protein [Alistipes sp.]